MVTCNKCGKPLLLECQCYDKLGKIKEFGRLAPRETDVIYNVLKFNKPLYFRVHTTTIKAEITPLEWGIRAQATFKPNEEIHIDRIELLDWDNELIYWRSESVTLRKNDAITWNWELKINP